MIINLNIPDADAPAIVDGVCAATNYDAGSGKTKAVWAKEQVVNLIKLTAKRGLLRASQTSINGTVDGVNIT